MGKVRKWPPHRKQILSLEFAPHRTEARRETTSLDALRKQRSLFVGDIRENFRLRPPCSDQY